ncbi:MAG: DUF2948 family protein [Holosporaceae bacterium]|nr:DUF2948 family protein [Holosporaceae bacterium]
MDREQSKFLIKASSIGELEIISALLQDSIFHKTAHSFHEDGRCLRVLMNRFCWEKEPCIDDDQQIFFRVNCGLYIYHVKAIGMSKNFKEITDHNFLNLLVVRGNEHSVILNFSDHNTLKIDVDRIQIYIKDLHDTYPTLSCPVHGERGMPPVVCAKF